ncbi:uncharacterized protein LOC130641015 [Hydractinia symbiolongicarpus]|uniref:uncharacterized protein LOC130641015 n=1 Tax=Hydractinia symbiolongicarpus TaxID=13093 RepID=UPI00254A2FE8|nr:uncharacterized protein LOC130641015 [Hydractinia symbiolongicarpus]
MSMPFRNTSEIVNPESEDLPESIAYFHNALIINPTFWNDNQKIRNHLEASVHKRYYIDTFLVYLKSLRLKILAYQSGEIIVNDNAEDTEFSIEDLTVDQKMVFYYVKSILLSMDRRKNVNLSSSCI